MTCRKLIDFCLTFPGAYEDYPFAGMIAHSDDGVWAAMRHRDNKKTFAHIYEKNSKLCVNLKCDPFEADIMRQMFTDVTPGFHLNKTHWNTVILDGDVPIDELKRQITNSYNLIKPKRKRLRRI